MLPLVWDVTEQAYYRFFLSTEGKTKKKVWMSKPIGTMATINFNRDEKKRKERKEKKKTVPKSSRVRRSTVTAVTNMQRWQRRKNRKRRSKGSYKRVR
jgi:hypothetical protein